MMNHDPHKTISLSDQIFERLEHDILAGEYPIGEVLTENKLSEQFGVSRTPIREVLRRLEQEHIVSISPKGATVLGINHEDIQEIYEIRTRLEGLAARWAALRMDESTLEELKKAIDLQEFYTERHDSENTRDMDSRFHELIYAGCGSVPMNFTLVPLHRRVMKFRKVSLSKGSQAADALAEHKAIFEAIANHEADQAEALMSRHVEKARDRILNQVMNG